MKAVDSRTIVVERQREKERREALEAKRNAPTIRTTAARRAELIACHADMPGTSTNSQAARLRRALRTGSVTTIEARMYLDIMSPASRVFSLIHNDGHVIHMRRVKQVTTRGTEHLIGQYTLIGE